MEANGVHVLLTCLVMLSMMDVLSSSPHPKPIVNGKAVRNNRFPFVVAFGYKSESTESVLLFCGGTLIAKSSSHSWAISSSHCFLDLKNRTVYAKLGGGDLNNNDAKWLRVVKIVSANMNIYTFQNDIALVKIETEHQQVIQRAKEMPTNNAECLIYGYGSSSHETNSVTSNTLRYGLVNPIGYDECEQILGRVTAPQSGLGQFCALGRKGVDACNGDSGSGLICRGNSGRFELVGITSHGMGCGEGTAGVYESVIHHKRWIDSVVRLRT